MRSRRFPPYFSMLPWLVAGVVPFFFPTGGSTSLLGTGKPWAEWVMASVAVAFGCWGFWRHGRPQITAAGVMCLSCALMVGYTGWYWAGQQGAELPGYIFTATAWGYFSTVAMYAIFWLPCEDRVPAAVRGDSKQASRAAATWSWKLGLVLVVACSGLSAVGVQGASLVADGAWIGVVFLAVGLLNSRRIAQVSVPRLVVIAAAFFVYFKYVFAGFGRLIVASLGLAIAIAICRQFKGRMVKIAILALIIPALAVAAQLRVNFIQQRYGSSAPTNIQGLGSLTSPLQLFGQEIQLHESGGLPLGHGSTFATTAVFLVPRSIWPSKPVGFGAVLTEIFSPNLESVHGSLAALSAGEWYYDFGNIGLLVMIAPLGLFVRWLDDILARSVEAPLDRRGLIRRVAAITAAAGLTDLFWVGSFTYLARTGPRLLLILGILLLFVGVPRWVRVNRIKYNDRTRWPFRERPLLGGGSALPVIGEDCVKRKFPVPPNLRTETTEDGQLF